MSKVDEEVYFEMLDTYAKVFEDCFPRMEYRQWDRDKCYEVMRECVNKNKSVHILYPIDMEMIY